MDISYTLMLPALQFLAKLTHSYGWSIILLTVIIRIIVWPLVAKSTRSMQRMSKVQPKIKAIQEKYKDDPELFQKKMMEFYSKNKVNPVGGCLPTLIQLPVLFALFATFTGPPFQDKGIPVKVTLVKQADAAKAKTVTNPTSGGSSPYVSQSGEMAKFVVQPGDETAVLPDGEVKSTDYSVRAVEGQASKDFKPFWKISHDTNAATIDPISGQAQFPAAGDVTIEAWLPDNQKIAVPIKVAPKEGGDSAFNLMPQSGDAYKVKTEKSEQTATFNANGQSVTVAVSPGPSTVVAGRGGVAFKLLVVSGAIPAGFQPAWHVSQDANAAKIDETGHAVFPRSGEVVVEGVVPGVAKDEPFFFISSIGKVAKGMELLQPRNWDVLGMIIAFDLTMYLSQMLMVSPGSDSNMDPEQAAIQKQTQQTMPIAMTAMFFFIPLPAGVYLYMVLSNVVQTLQSWLIMRSPAPDIIDVDDDSVTVEQPKGKKNKPSMPGQQSDKGGKKKKRDSEPDDSNGQVIDITDRTIIHPEKDKQKEKD